MLNNWSFRFVLFGFLALGVGMLAAWLSSFIFWKPNFQKGIGFMAAGIAVMAGDFIIRRKIDNEGVYQEVYFLPFIPTRIPVWLYGLAIAIGGVALLCTKD